MSTCTSSLLLRIFSVMSLVPACHEPASAPTTGAAGDGGPGPAGTSPSTIDSCPEPVQRTVSWGTPDNSPPASSGYESVQSVCLPSPPGIFSSCSQYSEACVLSRFSCGHSGLGDKVLGRVSVAEPAKEGEACCWKVHGGCVVGRPFFVDGRPVLAALRAGAGWSADADVARDGEALRLFAATLDEETRGAVAAVWAEDGRNEHASVASFAQFVLELLLHEAPPDLVVAAQRAMGDEIRHATRSFARAAMYGLQVEPGSLATAGALPRSTKLADFAARVAAEGCIAETVGALQLDAAAAGAVEPRLAALLRATAEEETEHALLAWRTVAFAIARGGAPVRAAVSAVFARAADHVGFGPCPAGGDDDALRQHGVLPRADRHDLAVTALTRVIAPAARALLGGWTTRDPAPPVLERSS